VVGVQGDPVSGGCGRVSGLGTAQTWRSTP
jgi:hypothetical protein